MIEKIIGYYSLNAASFEKDELPPALAKRLPHNPVLATVLGRLAIHREHEGRGLVKRCFSTPSVALSRRARRSPCMPSSPVPRTRARKHFYKCYGFCAFASEQRRLSLPLETFVKLGL